jgi:hypothetical protein
MRYNALFPGNFAFLSTSSFLSIVAKNFFALNLAQLQENLGDIASIN